MTNANQKNIAIIFHGLQASDITPDSIAEEQFFLFNQKHSYIKKIKKEIHPSLKIAYVFSSFKEYKASPCHQGIVLDRAADYLFYHNAAHICGSKDELRKMPEIFQGTTLLKSSPEFFAAAAEILQADPKDCLFITSNARIHQLPEKYPVNVCGFREGKKVINFLKEKLAKNIPPISSIPMFD